jgi:uncharacterized membrane protein YcgQ (UPF0703/DUF1980 family)
MREEEGLDHDEQSNGFEDSFEDDFRQVSGHRADRVPLNSIDNTLEEDVSEQRARAESSHEEDSDYNFVSEYSTHSGDESKVVEVTDEDYVRRCQDLNRDPCYT